jgi:hypothetical protein
MRQLLRVLLAIIYVTTTFTVLVGQTEAAGEQLGNARSSASPIQPQTDAHWATDPHFSHAKKRAPTPIYRRRRSCRLRLPAPSSFKMR